jgi:hypothetical protein
MINLVLSLCMTFGPYTEDIKDLCVDSYSDVIMVYDLYDLHRENMERYLPAFAKDETIVFYWYIKDYCLITHVGDDDLAKSLTEIDDSNNIWSLKYKYDLLTAGWLKYMTAYNPHEPFDVTRPSPIDP